MGGDLYTTKSTVEDFPWFCQKCMKENSNGKIECPKMNCPDYAKNDPNFENVD